MKVISFAWFSKTRREPTGQYQWTVAGLPHLIYFHPHKLGVQLWSYVKGPPIFTLSKPIAHLSKCSLNLARVAIEASWIENQFKPFILLAGHSRGSPSSRLVQRKNRWKQLGPESETDNRWHEPTGNTCCTHHTGKRPVKNKIWRKNLLYDNWHYFCCYVNCITLKFTRAELLTTFYQQVTKFLGENLYVESRGTGAGLLEVI